MDTNKIEATPVNEAEIRAVKTCGEALAGLDQDAAYRVLDFLCDRFVTNPRHKPAVTCDCALCRREALEATHEKSLSNDVQASA